MFGDLSDSELLEVHGALEDGVSALRSLALFARRSLDSYCRDSGRVDVLQGLACDAWGELVRRRVCKVRLPDPPKMEVSR